MVVYFSCDTAVSIPSFVLVVNLDNFCLDFLVFVWNPHPLQMVVEGRARKLSDCEQKGQRELLPQFLNFLRFLRWRRSSSKTKAYDYSKRVKAIPSCQLHTFRKYSDARLEQAIFSYINTCKFLSKYFPHAAAPSRQASPLLLCWAAPLACLYFFASPSEPSSQ